MSLGPLALQVLLMTLQNAPPGLDYERDKRFSKVCKLVGSFKYPPVCIVLFIFCYFGSFLYVFLSPFLLYFPSD